MRVPLSRGRPLGPDGRTAYLKGDACHCAPASVRNRARLRDRDRGYGSAQTGPSARERAPILRYDPARLPFEVPVSLPGGVVTVPVEGAAARSVRIGNAVPVHGLPGQVGASP